ncbi:GNAT family N-acetyltransferase [Micromonospora sp. WMMD714]|uniref:GNAT family N-acetyltransferase n=1 Tax=Micromonospora sp. WMMD714 TaxID=3016097 RepID=UPI00249A212C|nr:GNAT family N-acetyltransferase [Micromonospora sp. WMMD714]WFE66044.1 GNAT family N-acetyltransferase [Micromonospora sp. WMMD714]
MTAVPTSARRPVEDFGEVSIRPVEPDRDVEVIHDWVTRERSRFWGMRDASRERVHEIYTYLDSLTTHHAYLVHRDGRPVALFQTYEPAADPVGRCYDVRPGDFGIHLLIGPPDGGVEPGFTGVLLDAFLAFVLADPTRLRIVAEPDARNARAVDRLVRAGFVPGPLIDLPDKRARLLFLDRGAVRPAGRRPDGATG